MENTMSPTRLRLAEILRERNITQTKLAEMTGISENAISKLVGSPVQIRLDTVDKICRALNISKDELFGTEE
jgi:DNA-binding Xre family transcriptional regulator